ncbi:OmpA family protein [Altererythrobacter confluentis]|uniref:OmpA family protein n=1 Tax=Allopontixanthobacter confluentis TaxID=1849021 RepID=A0A6L7GFP1_9SPHN|nr:OmpA family protein [Allopontixanthobacter confluentis]MXP14490.1 OmpA family protein [Allopontixanthobacter confluentis]
MLVVSNRSRAMLALAMIAVPVSASLSASSSAQQNDAQTADITVNGQVPADISELADGPEVGGIIAARSGERIQIANDDGSSTVVLLSDATQVRSSKGLFGLSKSRLEADALLNGLPVSIKTVQWGGMLIAKQINFRGNDLKTASMIRSGTAQRFDEHGAAINQNAAATEALRGRLGDIDKYNVKSTTNVYFDTGKSVLSASAKNELCAAAAEAEVMDNALLLVVGYTDSTGTEDVNQALSEKRAGRVVNHLQQACSWKPYRMLTPTGMAEADPMASNDTAAGKAQNRRVSVNVLVSKGLDGL